MLADSKKICNQQFIDRSHNKNKAMWQVIGRYKNNYKEVVTIKNIVFNQITETSPQKIATEFNKYYLSIAGNIKRTLPPPAHFVFLFDTYEGAGVSELRYATQTEIIRTVKKMKNKNHADGMAYLVAC